MKIKFLISVWALLVSEAVLGQNPYWVFPPNYVDFKADQVKTLPSNMSYTKTSNDISNGFFSQAGTGKITMRKSTDLFTYVYPAAQFTTTYVPITNCTEVPLIPFIKDCDRYVTPSISTVVGNNKYIT
jgi:hypothetical protein